MRQFAGFGTPEETNQRYKELLKAGGGGLSVAFDLPTLMGRDPDHELSLGEVGKCGVSIVSLADMERLFDGIALGDITTSMTINSPAPMIFAMYLASPSSRGRLEDAVGHDPERHPQGVHRAEGVHLPAARVDAAHHRHLRVLREGSARSGTRSR
jgi:methylmalonyl-CoA mutase N-terminal domain/subunit